MEIVVSEATFAKSWFEEKQERRRKESENKKVRKERIMGRVMKQKNVAAGGRITGESGLEV